MEAAHPPVAPFSPNAGRGRRWLPLVAKSSAVLGLGFAVVYAWCLAMVLRGLYDPSPEQFCGTPVVGALAIGAVLFAPAALLLAPAILRARRGIPAGRPWRTVVWAAFLLLLADAVINWATFAPFLAP